MRREGDGEADGARNRGRGVRCDCAGLWLCPNRRRALPPFAAGQMVSRAYIYISSVARAHRFGFVDDIR